MKNITRFGIIAVLAIFLAFSFGVAVEVNRRVNATESMICSSLRNCVDSCRQIQNCSVYLNCIDNCLINATSAFGETASAFVASNNTTNATNLKKKTKMAKVWAVPLTFS